jgi:hypothetical protein
MSDTDTDGTDRGVAAENFYCQNFEEHPDKEPKMRSGPFDGVMCPECGRMAGGGPPLDIPFVDGEGRSVETETEQ